MAVPLEYLGEKQQYKLCMYDLEIERSSNISLNSRGLKEVRGGEHEGEAMSSHLPARMCCYASMQRRMAFGSVASVLASAQASSGVKLT
ncbi:hypothetical protein E2562_035717 [Oryza meyeriana var. granulata]|uniref:Uncharacterized protein n=1 Tax=Oryza meyeriana var. granulata TaxID=110450 RepID=A0A6G1C0P7_9ORYZ|nr:hypothetical protein E2562_035717 [Oryza meyeriana var. granulata]